MAQKMKANIVGSSFYKGAGALIPRIKPGSPLVLKRKPDNPHDKNAIAVFFRFSGIDTQLGHLSRGLAELLAPKIDAGAEVRCTKASVVGAVVNLEWDAPADPEAKDEVKEATDTWLNRFKGLGL